jgi:hypothetical protein
MSIDAPIVRRLDLHQPLLRLGQGMICVVKIFKRDWLFLVAHDFAGGGIHKMHARASGAGRWLISVVV